MSGEWEEATDPAAARRLHTALRVLKGAVVSVLRIPTGGTTQSYRFVSATRAVLGIKFAALEVEPDAAVLAAIEAAARSKVVEDAPVHVFVKEKADAEALYGGAPYDGFHKRDAQTLFLAWIAGWSLSQLSGGDAPEQLLSSTRGVGVLTLTSTKWAKGGKLDLHFSLDERETTPATTASPAPSASGFTGPSTVEVDAINMRVEKKAKVPQTPAGAAAVAVGAAGEKGEGKGAASASAGGGAASSSRGGGASAAAAAPTVVDAAPAGGGGGGVGGTAKGEEVATGGEGQTITPWEVDADEGIDYEKLIVSFGCSRITEDTIARVERLTNRRAHRFLRRGLFFSHRDLGALLDAYERGEPFYLYTGRGPSSEALHLGHLVPFQFTQWLQEAFNVPLVIQLTDDEKFLWKEHLTLAECHKLGRENTKDIIACGFSRSRTFIFSDLDYIQHMYRNVLKVQKAVTYSQARGIFGFTGDANIGKSAFPAVQAAPSFSSSFHIPLKGAPNMWCLIPQAIDQDPYFRMTRDVAPRLGFKKPSLIHSKFFPALQGSKSKMSSSGSTSSSIMVTDTAKEVKNKVNRYAFSGGQALAEDQRRLGADLSVDVPYQYLTFFLEDDEELKRIGEDYAAGRLLSGEVKAKLISVLVPMVEAHQAARALVTDALVDEFMSVRELEFGTCSAT